MPFLPISKKDQVSQDTPGVKRLSMDCKATVKIGAFSRDGKTRDESKASDHDFEGIKLVGKLSRKVYAKGVTLSKTAMQAVEARLERNPLLPK
jgi:hypothetical protein